MNLKNIKKREILSYKEFLKVSADPWNKENLRKEDRTGFHKIKPEKLFDYIGYKDAIFNKTSKMDFPKHNSNESGSVSFMETSE